MILFFKKYRIYIIILSILILGFAVFVIVFSIAPRDFPNGKIVSIEKNMTVSQAAAELKKQGIIKSTSIYKVYTLLLHDGLGVQAGKYLFDRSQSVLRVAYRTAYGVQGLEKKKIVIIEGATVNDISMNLTRNIPNFDSDGFLELAKDEEGYFFPDTYFFNPNVTPQEVINEMKTVFASKIVTVQTQMKASGRQLADIVKMASIVEKEANNDTDRQIIAGILWKRIDTGMPLQVDPPFYYFLSKISTRLTLDDLKTESPYNLYLHKGLPPTPIDNPGLDAILATVQPKISDYWYYLSDSNGTMHYAKTHEGHLANKEKYLR